MLPCSLFKMVETDTTWTVTEVEMKHLSEKIKKHDRTRANMENMVKLGRVNIATQEVDKNRRILSVLNLRSHNKAKSSDNPGVFKGLIDLGPWKGIRPLCKCKEFILM